MGDCFRSARANISYFMLRAPSRKTPNAGSLCNAIAYTNPPKVDRCGLDVDSRRQYDSNKCGPNVDPMWTRCGLGFDSFTHIIPANVDPTPV